MVAFLVHREDRLGLTVHQVADLEVRGLDRCAHDVADHAHPRLPDRVVELVARERTEVAQHDDRRQPDEAQRAQQGVAHQRAAADPGVADPLHHQPDGGGSVLVAGGGRVTDLDHLLVDHQPAGPVDQADADAEERDAEGASEHQVGGAQAADGVPVVADLEDEVGDEEADQGDRRDAEQRRHLTFGPLLLPRVDVGRAPLVGRQPGVGDGLISLWDRREVLVAHASTLLLEERVVWAAIQTAKPTQAPMPTSHATSPSLTGPMPPRPNPPYDGWSSSDCR